MNKKITVGTGIVLILLAAFLTFQITYHYVGSTYQKKVDTLTKTQSDFSLLAEADPLIREYFYGAMDEEKVEDGLLRGYLSALEDPYSTYLTPDEYTRYKKEQSSAGGGVGLRLTWDSARNVAVVNSVLRDSPAALAGVTGGDVLLEIDGVSTKDMSFADVLKALSGEEGAQVKLTIRREIAAQTLEMDFELTRTAVEASCLDFEILDGEIGYVRIFSFEKGSDKEFVSAVNALAAASCRGIVFDVRNTSGGTAEAAAKMLDRLLPQGVILRSVDHKGEKGEVKSDETALDLPMAILIDEGTAFAAELFAASMKDCGAAILVGKTTYGKSMEQTPIPLTNGAALLLTTKSYSPPTSPSFEKTGVEPDEEVSLGNVSLYLVEKNDDPQLKKAISLL